MRAALLTLKKTLELEIDEVIEAAERQAEEGNMRDVTSLMQTPREVQAQEDRSDDQEKHPEKRQQKNKEGHSPAERPYGRHRARAPGKQCSSGGIKRIKRKRWSRKAKKVRLRRQKRTASRWTRRVRSKEARLRRGTRRRRKANKSKAQRRARKPSKKKATDRIRTAQLARQRKRKIPSVKESAIKT